MKLDQLLRPEMTYRLDPVDTRDALLKALSQRIADQIDGVDAAELHASLLEREERGVTSTPDGVAFPHAMLEGIDRSFIAAAYVPGGVNMGRREHPPCDVVFVLVGPTNAAWEHVRALARLARICHTPGTLDHLRGAADAAQLHERLLAEDARHV